MTVNVVPSASTQASDDVALWAEQDFGLHLDGLLDIEGGLDAHARVWQGTDTTGALWCVKVSSNDVRFGLLLSVSAATARVPGVAAPLLSLSGQRWAERGGQLMSVSPWVDGLDGVDGGADSVPWEQFGRSLRALHGTAPPMFTPKRRGIRRLRHSPRRLLKMADASLGAPDVQDRDFVAAASVWQENLSRLERLALWEREQRRARTPAVRVPVHGDPHLGNVVVDGEHNAWLIDFDDATIAPREVDLMLIELGVITGTPITAGQRRLFRQGYGLDIPIDENRITRFACVRAIEDAVTATRHFVESPAGERSIALAALQSLFDPPGLIAQTESRLDATTLFPSPTQHTEKR